MPRTKKAKDKKPRGVFERNGISYVQYFDQYGVRHRYSVGTIEDAVAEYHKQKRLVSQERYDPDIAKRKREVLLSTAIKDYLADVEAVTRDLDHQKRHGKMWSEALGHFTLSEVKPQMIERWKAKRLTCQTATGSTRKWDDSSAGTEHRYRHSTGGVTSR